MRGLRQDCTRYMRETHGEGWCSLPQRHPGGGTKLGRDQAISSMLWHASHTTWFEFHAGSRLGASSFPHQVPAEELAWQASHTFASKQSYLGLQDAGRKARPCSKTCGAWVGAKVHILKNLGVWLKMRAILEKWEVALAVVDPTLAHKELL